MFPFKKSVVWLHFQTFCFNRNLDLAFLVIHYFGAFIQYLTKSMVRSWGPSLKLYFGKCNHATKFLNGDMCVRSYLNKEKLKQILDRLVIFQMATLNRTILPRASAILKDIHLVENHLISKWWPFYWAKHLGWQPIHKFVWKNQKIWAPTDVVIFANNITLL